MSFGVYSHGAANMESINRIRSVYKQLKMQQQRDKKLFAERVIVLDENTSKIALGRAKADYPQSRGFEPNRHYSPKEVLTKANGQLDRVNIVIAAALRRHRREMERGYAILSDHVV